ncbi:hypothetical protein NEFER03_0579 [Nematocida sp. LUAm3]|nr:hypothetical protein NEFER03_0579 [Nematocida sp. LUAm3]KAI5175546.1 hypothetical protein NEFER02_1452 [Nematocida sp. LUAm2]KAI5178424.1 hypothetical protein NEFER01_1571 [Nematocida sp. LUAm1]
MSANGFSLERAYGSSREGLFYNEEKGELFIGMDRVIKKIMLRSSCSRILSLITEDRIQSIFVEKDLLLALDTYGRVYIYSLCYDVEIGRMAAKGCQSAIIKNKNIYLDYEGYLQEWVIESNGFFRFKKTKHITGSLESITMMKNTEKGILLSGYDGTLRHYDLEGDKTKLIAKGRVQSVGAKMFNGEIVNILANGEISKLYEIDGKWNAQVRKYTKKNILSADVSSLGDLVVVIDAEHNAVIYNTLADSIEPVKKIFISDQIVSAQFIEQDEWIVLSGHGGSLVWEWRTNSLLFNEQNANSQRSARECHGMVVSGTDSGEVFLWDKDSSLCIKKIQAHTSPVSEIIPLERGFISVSSGGEWKKHSNSGDIVKAVDTEKVILVADADEEIVVVGGVGFIEVYDQKRSRKILEKEIEIPLAIKIFENLIYVVTNTGIVSIGENNYLEVDGAESFVLGDISVTKEGLQIAALGESGMVYIFDEELEEQEDYRAIHGYINGLGNATPLSMKHTHEGALILAYEVERPDRLEKARKSLYASMFQGGYEVERWIVQERIREKESGKIFSVFSIYGTMIGICAEQGLFLFSDHSKGLKPMALWQKETPSDIEEQIKSGDALSGMTGACRLQDIRLMEMAINAGDPHLLGKYFSIELSSSLFQMLLSLISKGNIERPLIILKELLQRTQAPPLLRRQLIHLLSSVAETTIQTTGYIDAINTYPHLTEK